MVLRGVAPWPCADAGWVRCAQVMHFWKKAERVVAYKQQSVVDARKKEAMDKHLSFLVGQTQKYSSLLAQRLAANEQDLPALLSPPPPRPTPPAPQLTAQQTPTPALLEAPGSSPQHPDAALKASAIPAVDGGERSAEPGPSAAPVGSRAAEIAALGAPLADSSGGAEEDEEEFQMETGTEEEDDDEATLEEEEVRIVLSILHLHVQLLLQAGTLWPGERLSVLASVDVYAGWHSAEHIQCSAYVQRADRGF